MHSNYRDYLQWWGHLIAMGKNTVTHVLCILQAVTNEWYYQMIYDDLPLWGFVGKIDKILQPPELDVKIMMYTHLHFDIKYNIDKVIEVSLSTEESIDISDKAAGSHALPVEFTYSVQWIPTDITFDKRLQRFKNELMAPIHLEVRRHS